MAGKGYVRCVDALWSFLGIMDGMCVLVFISRIPDPSLMMFGGGIFRR